MALARARKAAHDQDHLGRHVLPVMLVSGWPVGVFVGGISVWLVEEEGEQNFAEFTCRAARDDGRKAHFSHTWRSTSGPLIAAPTK